LWYALQTNVKEKMMKVGLSKMLIVLIFGMFSAIASAEGSVRYQAHVEDYGWMSEVHDYQVAGTIGRSLRLEAVRIYLEGLPGVSIGYQAHVQNIGWQDVRYNGEVAGTTGRSLRLEAIRINLFNAPKNMAVCYRVHVQDYGWLQEACNGQTAGTVGQSRRAEAIQIRLADISEVPPTQPPQGPPSPPLPVTSIYGNVDAAITIDTYQNGFTSDPINCGVGRFWLEKQYQEVMGQYRLGSSGFGKCYYRAYFPNISPGSYRVSFDGYNSCNSTQVIAGQVSYVNLSPNNWRCR
jgi:uncharacterized protein YjdB